MSERAPLGTAPICSDCVDPHSSLPPVSRRGFLRVVGQTAAALSVAGSGFLRLPTLAAAETPAAAATTAKPAEALIKELFADLSAEQKTKIVLPWDHSKTNGLPTRLGMYNAPIAEPIADVYTKPQQELVERILKSISSGEEGYEAISRGGNFDNSGSLIECGANIFGDPTDGGKYSWVFTGHHLTVRCDGNSEPGAAFGGPMYYGHSLNGYSEKNVFNFQTKSVLSVFDALSGDQRKQAIVSGSPGEQAGSVKLRPEGEATPGIAYTTLSEDQRKLVETVMRTLLSPYRKEDGDEVMDIVKNTGGMDKLHLAFYEDSKMNDQQPWHFWRLEGPGFVWNYRILPHVHCFVNINSQKA